MNFRRYRVLLILFLVLLVYGQRVVPATEFIPDKDQYNFAIGMNQQVIFDHLPTNTNQLYRATFALRLLPSNLLLDNSLSSQHLNVIRRTAFGEDRVAVKLDIKQQTGWQYFELIFTGSGDDESLIAQKDDTTARATFALRPLTVSALDSNSSLKPTVFGGGSEVVSSDTTTAKPDKVFRLKGMNRVLAQSFTAITDRLSSVELNLSFRGYGGAGDYQLALFEADSVGSSSKIGARVSSLIFTKNSIAEFRVSEDTYHFPLSAKLEKGKEYLLMIDASRVKVSPFHYMFLNGRGVSDEHNQLFRLKTTSGALGSGIKGQLGYKLFGYSPYSIDGQALLSGQVVQDLGNTLLTSYTLFPEINNGLDVDSFNPGDIASTRPAYSNEDMILESLASSGAYYRYQIPLGGLLKKAVLNYKTSDPASDSIEVSYSFDGKNWQKITPKPFSRDGEVRAELSGQTKTIWLEIAYRPVHDTQAFFGFKSLNFTAEVNK